MYLVSGPKQVSARFHKRRGKGRVTWLGTYSNAAKGRDGTNERTQQHFDDVMLLAESGVVKHWNF